MKSTLSTKAAITDVAYRMSCRSDWIRLALAALEQAGVSESVRDEIETLAIDSACEHLDTEAA